MVSGAFRIDGTVTFGVNDHLLDESGTVNESFEPGEVWCFIVPNVSFPANLPPTRVFDSAGGFCGSSLGFPPSTASILGTQVVPEPASARLLGGRPRGPRRAAPPEGLAWLRRHGRPAFARPGQHPGAGRAPLAAADEEEAMGLLRLLRTGKGPMDGWIARGYDRGVQTAFREILPALVEDLLDDFTSARRVLDAGCGPGQFTILIAERLPQAELWGIDLAPTMIELARAHAQQSPAAARLHFELADVTKLPFPDAHFDHVVSSGSIKHWPDPVAGLRELHRVLAPGGCAVIGEMNRLAKPAAVAAQRERIRHWFFRRIYPRVFAKALTPEEARAIFAASPFGPPERERMLLDGIFWLFEARKRAA